MDAPEAIVRCVRIVLWIVNAGRPGPPYICGLPDRNGKGSTSEPKSGGTAHSAPPEEFSFGVVLNPQLRCLAPPLDPAVQPGETAVHGVAEDVRDRLTRPRAPRLRAIPVAVQLLANFRDALAFEVPAEDKRDDAGLVLPHLEQPVHIVVAVRARVCQECVRLLDRVVERLGALLSARPPEDLPLVQPAFHAELLQGELLRVRAVVLQEFAR